MPFSLKLVEGRKDPSYTFHRITGDPETLKKNHDFIEEKAKESLGAGFVRIEKKDGMSTVTLVTVKKTPGFRQFKSWLSEYDF